MLWHTSQDGTLHNKMLTPSFSLLPTRTPDTPKWRVHHINQYKFITFLIMLHIHIYALYQFITDFEYKIYPQNDMLLYVILIFYNFSNTIYKLPEDGAEAFVM